MRREHETKVEGHSLLEKKGTEKRDKEKAEIKGPERRAAVRVSTQPPPLPGGLTDVAMAMALASGVACSRPGSVSLTSAAAAPHHGGGPQLWRLSRGLRRGWRRRKRKPTNSPNGRQLGQAGGGAAGGLGRRCGTLSKGARSVLSPRPPGAAGLARPPELPAPGLGDTPGPRGVQLRCGAGAGQEEGATRLALDASPGRPEWPRGLGKAARAAGLDERV